MDIVHEIEHWPHESELARIGKKTTGIGGGAANVISALVRLDTGLDLWPMGLVGDDAFGRDILARCKEMGLPADLIRVKANTETAHTHVMSVPGQSRTFFYQGGANDIAGPADFPVERLGDQGARIFYLGYLMLLAELDRIGPDGSTGAAHLLRRARGAGMITCVDLVSSSDPNFRESVGASLPEIDYLMLNEIEVARATGRAVTKDGDTTGDEDLAQMARDLIEAGVRRAVVVHCPTKALWCGADGQLIWGRSTPLSPDRVVSHLGAGDAFCAGLLIAVHEGWGPERSLALAHAVARASLKGVTASEAIPKLYELRTQLGQPKEAQMTDEQTKQ